MHTSQHSVAKRTAAFLLLALILCVHMVKLLHVHHATDSNVHRSEPGYSKAGLIETACSMCAFQWAKDTTTVQEPEAIGTITYPTAFNNSLPVSLQTALAGMQAGRGPPVI